MKNRGQSPQGRPQYYDDESWPKGWGCAAKGIPTMLFLQLKDGEYLTIGNDIVIQVFTNSTIRVSVQAPKDMTILRGEVLERNGEERPQCLQNPESVQTKRSKKRKGSDEQLDRKIQV